MGGDHNGAGEPMRIEHIAMYVNDLEGAKDFFCQIFSCRSQ